MGALDLQLRLQLRETDALIHRMNRGDKSAGEHLFALILPVLFNIATSRLKKAHSLVRVEFDEIALVNEATLKLSHKQFENTNHLFASYSLQMNSVLVDYTRKRLSGKNGRDRIEVSLDDLTIYLPAPDTALIALDEALENLAKYDGGLAQVVELLYFGGCTIEETARVLGVSTDTVKRRWKKAKIYLRKILTDTEESGDGSEAMKRD